MCSLFSLLSSSQAGKNWMFNNAKTPPHCELMTSHLRNRITADGAHFELRLHLIYLTNDVLHHWYVNQTAYTYTWINLLLHFFHQNNNIISLLCSAM